MGRPRGSRNKPKDQAAAPKKPRKNKARAPKPQATASESSEGSSDNPKMPNKNRTVALAKRMDSFATQSKDLGKSKKDIIDKAVETQHFNRAALGAALAWRRRAKKDPAKFALEFAHFLSYVDDLELDKIANQNLGMDLNGEDDEGGETDMGDFGEDAPPDEQPATGRSPGLRVVPGPAAPDASSDVPSPAEGEEAA